jgi:hypothetical protein
MTPMRTKEMRSVIGLSIEFYIQTLCSLAIGAFIGAFLVEEHYRKKRDKDGH